MSGAPELRIRLSSMADENGEIAFTTNTRGYLEEGVSHGLVAPASGKFKCLEPGKLNSIYRLTKGMFQ